MLKRIIPYLLVVLLVWYGPELYLFSKNLSNYIYKEAVVSNSGRVEVKVVKKVPYLPVKFAVLAPAQKGYRVEMVSTSKNFSRSIVGNESGEVVFESLPQGPYEIHVGKEVAYTPEEILEIENAGLSVFKPGETLPISITSVTIQGDSFVVPVLLTN